MSVKGSSEPMSRDGGGSQLDIFAVAARIRRESIEAPPFVHDNEHSRTAAVAIRPVAGTLRARVLAAIEAAPAGLTDEEGCIATGMNPSTWRPRRVELWEQGLIRRAGEREAKSGRSMAVWAAAAGVVDVAGT